MGIAERFCSAFPLKEHNSEYICAAFLPLVTTTALERLVSILSISYIVLYSLLSSILFILALSLARSFAPEISPAIAPASAITKRTLNTARLLSQPSLLYLIIIPP